MAYRSRPRPSSTLGAKASTMCPYYLDGDLGRILVPRAEARGRPDPAGDTRCHPRLSSTGGCGYCAVFKGRPRGLRARAPARWPATGDAVSQNSTACAGSSSAVCRAARAARLHEEGARLGAAAGRVSGTTAGPARFGRHARPHDRRPTRPGPLATEVANGGGRRRVVRAPVWCSLERR